MSRDRVPKLVAVLMVYPTNSISATTSNGYSGVNREGSSEIVSRATYIFVLCAALNSCNLGYDIGVSTEAARLIQHDWNLSDVQRQIFVGSINFWAMPGAMLAHFFTDGYGRRATFVVAALGVILGLVVMTFSSSFHALLLGRALVGLGVGIGLAIDPMYIAEISPSSHRGRLVTYSELAINIGIVMGFSSGVVFAHLPVNLEWRAMLLSGTILPSIMILLAATLMPESPRWLVSMNRTDEARDVLQLLHPGCGNVELILRDISNEIELEQIAVHAVGWGAIFSPSPSYRRMLLVGVGSAIAQQAVGIDAIQYYLLDIVEQAGISARSEGFVLILLGLVKLAFISVGGALFDRVGRRYLFFVSLLGMSFSLLSLCLYFFFRVSNSAICIVFLAIYLSFFSVGMGPGAWLVPSEVFALSIRGKAMSLATLSNRATATLVSSTFLSTVDGIGWSGFFLLECMICVVVLGLFFFFLPETKGRSLEEMSLYFAEITGDTTMLDAEARLLQHQQLSLGSVQASQSETIALPLVT